MKRFLKKVWQWLDGNKTIIGTGTLLALDKWGAGAMSPDVLNIVQWVVAALTGASLAHHYQKGYFSTKPPNYK